MPNLKFSNPFENYIQNPKKVVKYVAIMSVNHIQNNLEVISSFINLKYWRVYSEDQLNDATWTNTCVLGQSKWIIFPLLTLLERHVSFANLKVQTQVHIIESLTSSKLHFINHYMDARGNGVNYIYIEDDYIL